MNNGGGGNFDCRRHHHWLFAHDNIFQLFLLIINNRLITYFILATCSYRKRWNENTLRAGQEARRATRIISQRAPRIGCAGSNSILPSRGSRSRLSSCGNLGRFRSRRDTKVCRINGRIPPRTTSSTRCGDLGRHDCRVSPGATS